MSAALEEQLAAIVGPEHVLTDASVTASYETDWTGRFELLQPLGCVYPY